MKNLYESILDSDEDIFARMDKDIMQDWLKQYASGEYKIKFNKTGNGVTLKGGSLTIKDFKGDKFPDEFKFFATKIKGNINIINCDITTLDGLFNDTVILDGDLHIDNCKKLKSLGQLPTCINGNVSIFGNKSLKSLEGIAEHIYGILYVAKNGKKFKKEEIIPMVGDLVTRIDTISESFDEAYEAMITESEQKINEELNEPHLLKLAEFLKRKAKEVNNKSWNFSYLLGKYGIGILWDKISSADVESFAWPHIDKTVITKCRRIISGSKSGFILLQNKSGEFTTILLPNKRYVDLNTKYSYTNYPKSYDATSTSLVNKCESAYEITLVYCDEMEAYKLQNDRRQSRVGMVLNTPEYYKEVAKENVKRYKEIIAQHKVLKVSDADKYNAKIQDIVMRALKATTIVNTHPDKYEKNIYELEYLMRYIHGDGSGYGPTAKGLLELYTSYTKLISRIYNKKAWGSPEESLKEVKEFTVAIDSKISSIEKYLKIFGV